MPLGQNDRACAPCRARTALLGSLVGRIEHHRRDRHRLDGLLALGPGDLVRALGLADTRAVRAPADPPVASGPVTVAVCRHDPCYPDRLLELAAPPAILHVGGHFEAAQALLQAPMVAVVGSRAPSEYGREVARDLSAALAGTGVCVVSGMAVGIDGAAHDGALLVGGPTVAILPGGVDIVYPPAKRALYRHLLSQGAVWAELPTGVQPRRWCFAARNRIIAALAQVTVIVEARERSGALITAGYARDLGHEVAAVPGPVTSGRSAGTNALIRDGAHLVRDAQDVLDLLYGVGMRCAPRAPPVLDKRLAGLLELVRSGRTTAEEVARAGVALSDAQAGLTELELLGRVRRTLSGRYLPVLA